MIHAMILAAGFGRRMHPVSEHLPKALLPIGGKSLLEWNLEWLAREGFEDATINLHHRAEMLEKWIARWRGRPRLRGIRETEILGTAGGLANARRLLRSDPVLVLNMDQLFRPALGPATELHRERGALVTLFCVPDAHLAQVSIRDGRVEEILPRPDPSDASLAAFTGVYLLSQEALAELPAEGFVELGPHLRRWAASGRMAASYVDAQPFREVGTPAHWADLQRELGGPGGESIARALTGSTEPAISARRGEWRGDQSSHLPRVALLRAADGFFLELEGERRAIDVPDDSSLQRIHRFLVEHWPSGGWGPDASVAVHRVTRLAGDGSARSFYRAVAGAESRVVIVPPEIPPDPTANRVYPRRREGPDEVQSFVYVAGFLEARKVPASRVHAGPDASGLLLVNDLGSVHLFDRVSDPDPRAWQATERLYEEALDLLVRMRAPGTPWFDPARTGNPDFDAAFAREYEAGYFHREMVGAWAGLRDGVDGVIPAYDAIARATVEGSIPGVVHRDFQSRNLLATRKGIAIIDFQGARSGPAEYDVASLLFDPYARLSPERRGILFDRWRRATGASGDSGMTRRFAACAASRLMQALGAYAYLGGRLGKPGFLEHAPHALRTLAELLRTSPELTSLPRISALADLADRVRERISTS